MEPEFKMDRLSNQWPPMSESSMGNSSPEAGPVRRVRRSSSRRPRNEATRTMLEMLRALAQSEANTLEQASGLDMLVSDGPTACTAPVEPVTLEQCAQAELTGTSAEGSRSGQPSGLMLLRAKVFGPEPDDVELHCRYCNRVFKLQEGGACFEGNAACSSCEQRLNRDLVLPAVSKHRPHLYHVCDVAEGPEDPKRPAWARKRGEPGRAPRDKDADRTGTTSLDERPEETLQQV